MNDDRASGHAGRLWHFAMIVACTLYAGGCTGKIGDLMGGWEGDPTGAATNGRKNPGTDFSGTASSSGPRPNVYGEFARHCLLARRIVDVSDVHATILRLLGIDHLGLTYKYHGVDQRLTPLTRESKVIEAILA